jgi:ATP-dependent RNA helicase DDX54/DBP10
MVKHSNSKNFKKNSKETYNKSTSDDEELQMESVKSISDDEKDNQNKADDLFGEEKQKKIEEDNLVLETHIGDLRKSKKNLEKKAKGFRSFSLSNEIIEGIKRMGYKNPTPIQRKSIPSIMSGFNVIAHSRTGSGKTAAFVLPIIQRLKEHSKIVGCRCLIVCPTRELAHQTMNFCRKLGKFTNLKYALLVGGNELEGQFERLAQNPDIIIATPGRVVHHLVRNNK